MTIRSRLFPALLALAACGPSDEPGPPADADSARDSAAATVDSVDVQPGGYVFDPSNVRVGDTIAGLRVKAADVQRAADGDWVGTVRFEGEVQVAGALRPHPSEEVDALCFFVEETHRARLPRFTEDQRRPWFCFSNQAEAREMVRAIPEGGTVELIIDQFTYHFAHTDVVNGARLVRPLAHVRGDSAA